MAFYTTRKPSGGCSVWAADALNKELSADRRGARYLEAAGYRPTAMIDLVLLVKDVLPVHCINARLANLTGRASVAEGTDAQFAKR